MTEPKDVEVLRREEVKFWTHRLLAEKAQRILELTNQIKTLNHQAENFPKMHRIYQNVVLEDLNKEFMELGWKYRFEREEHD